MHERNSLIPILHREGLRKRKFAIQANSTYLDSSSSALSMVNDITYSSVRKKRCSAKSGLLPPPLPSVINQFPIHTPPSTPRHQRMLQCSSKPTTPKSYIQTTAQANELDKSHSELAPQQNDKLLNEKPVNCGFIQSPQDCDPIMFTEPDLLLEQLIQLPDTSTISEQVDRYFPVLLSLRAPPLQHWSSCLSPGCNNNQVPLYNCNDCFDTKAYCQECTKARHTYLPFHRICTWSEEIGCYSPVRWTELEMVWRLSHEDGTPCTSSNTIRQLQVFHVNGMHNFFYYQCECYCNLRKHSTAAPTQLLSNKLFPATSGSPTSAFTFELLGLFDILNLTTFTNIKQFCDAVIGLTPRDHNHSGEAPGRLRSNLHYALRLWRLFRLMMTFGYFRYSDLVGNSIVKGCPACPQPKVNIPDNWQDHPQKELLYSLCLSGDGNFHLQSRILVKNVNQDPSFFGDSGFFVPYKMYKEYTAAAQLITSSTAGEHCSGKAGNPSRDRVTPNLGVAGIFAWQCRHGLFKAHGVADFPKGERFDIIDAPFLKIVNDAWKSGLERIIGIFDSACRYKVKIHDRCCLNPHTPLDREFWDRLTPESSSLQWFVNAFHQYSHNPECADDHSLRNSPNIGMVSGEEIETAWAILNHLQYSVREMDSGARIDMITAHMLSVNEGKVNKMGERLVNRFLEADQQCLSMQDEFSELEAGLEEVSPGITQRYRELYEERGGDQFRPDPTKTIDPTRRDTLAKLCAEEQMLCSSSSVSVVLLADQGLELQEKWASLNSSKTKNQAWFKREKALEIETTNHYNDVCAYFPVLLTESPKEGSRCVSLASAFELAQSISPGYARWFSAELNLRVGVGHDLLQEIRSTTGVLNYYSRKQRREIRGQQEMKNVAQSQKRVSSKRSRFIQKYIDNWKKIQILLDLSSLTMEEKMLYLKGLKEMSRSDDFSFFIETGIPASGAANKSEKQISWIWRVSMLDQPGEFSTQSLQELESGWESEARRLLWLQTFTRLERWKEELLLANEEIRRLSEWYSFHIKMANERALSSLANNGTREARGYHAVLCENLKNLRLDFENLPEAIKRHQNSTTKNIE